MVANFISNKSPNPGDQVYPSHGSVHQRFFWSSSWSRGGPMGVFVCMGWFVYCKGKGTRHTHTYIYICMYVCIYIYIHRHTCISMYKPMCEYVYMIYVYTATLLWCRPCQCPAALHQLLALRNPVSAWQLGHCRLRTGIVLQLPNASNKSHSWTNDVCPFAR